MYAYNLETLYLDIYARLTTGVVNNNEVNLLTHFETGGLFLAEIDAMEISTIKLPADRQPAYMQTCQTLYTYSDTIAMR